MGVTGSESSLLDSVTPMLYTGSLGLDFTAKHEGLAMIRQTETKLAYSYGRFSDKPQERGDSISRQTRMFQEFISRKGWTEAEQDFFDEGRSAFKGKHLDHELGRFLALCESGSVPRGSVLVIEKIDRLSRLPPKQTEDLVYRILETGAEVCSVSPELHLTPPDVNDYPKRMMLLSLAFMAHEYSKALSGRVKSAWAGKHKRAMEGEKLTKRTKLWLTLREDRKGFDQDPQAVKAVRLIFQLALDGLGIDAIVKYLAAHKVKHPLGGDWVRKYVHRLLHDRAVLGEYVLPTGEIIKDYYGKGIIDPETFSRVQAVLASRKRKGGPRGKKVSNLFTGLIYSGSSVCHLTEKAPGRPALASYDAIKGKTASYVSFPYKPLEEAILFAFHITPPSFDEGSKALRQEIADHEQAQAGRLESIATLKARYKKTKSPALLDLLLQEEADHEQGAKQLDFLRAKQASTTSHETQSAMDLILRLRDNPEDLDLRQRVKGKMAQLIERIDCQFTNLKGKIVKGALVKVTYVDGSYRTIEIEYDAQKHTGRAEVKGGDKTMEKWVLDWTKGNAHS